MTPAEQARRPEGYARHTDPTWSPMSTPVLATPVPPAVACRHTKTFASLSDPEDLLAMTCDLGLGHGGTHHDPALDARWYA